MNIALSTFAAWPKTVYGRVAFTAVCPCGRDAVWEQVGQAGPEYYEISCPCGAAQTVPTQTVPTQTVPTQAASPAADAA